MVFHKKPQQKQAREEERKDRLHNGSANRIEMERTTVPRVKDLRTQRHTTERKLQQKGQNCP